MQMKKMLAAALSGALLLTAASVVPAAVGTAISATVEAKGGGVKMAAPKAPAAAPKTPAKTTPDARSNANAGTNNASSKTTEQANGINSKQSATNQPSAAQAQSGSRIGSIMRGIGIFAGGMFLGSLLSSLFGMGSGFLADLLGVLMNVVLLALAIGVIRWLWNKFRGNGRGGNGGSRSDAYREGYEAAMRAQREQQQPDIIDITPRDTRPHVQDIQPPQDGKRW